MAQTLKQMLVFARLKGVTLPQLKAQREALPCVAAFQDADACIHIRARVHAHRTLARVIYWTGSGRASELGEVK